MKKLIGVIGICFFVLTMMINGGNAQSLTKSDDELVGTVWVTEGGFDSILISPSGVSEPNSTTNSVLRILETRGGGYTISFHWWSEQQNANVVEYGVMVQIEGDLYAYTEVDNTDKEGFFGFSGNGYIKFDETKEMLTYSQLGIRADGSSFAFRTTMKKTDNPPEPPMPATYPVK